MMICAPDTSKASLIEQVSNGVPAGGSDNRMKSLGCFADNAGIDLIMAGSHIWCFALRETRVLQGLYVHICISFASRTLTENGGYEPPLL